jgi:hypothetical protein
MFLFCCRHSLGKVALAGQHSVQTTLALLHSSPPASVSQTLGLQAHITTPDIGSIFQSFFFLNFASRIPISQWPQAIQSSTALSCCTQAALQSISNQLSVCKRLHHAPSVQGRPTVRMETKHFYVTTVCPLMKYKHELVFS